MVFYQEMLLPTENLFQLEEICSKKHVEVLAIRGGDKSSMTTDDYLHIMRETKTVRVLLSAPCHNHGEGYGMIMRAVRLYKREGED